MEKNEPLNTSYSKKEWWIDSTTFLASSALTCAARSITPLDPAAIGLILSAGANTAAIQATSAFAQKYGIDSRLIQICALISALALSTLALPWILSAASLQTLALLSFETAVESTLVHLAFKTAAYGAFRTGLYIKDSFTVALPTSLQNVQKMSPSELHRVRDHLVDFPSKAGYIPLPVHQELHTRLKEANLESPPLTDFSELGEEWSDRNLDTLLKQDLRGLPLHKRAQLNELFFARDFPPQERPYELGELPELDTQTVQKLATTSKVSWAHLILRLNSKVEIPSGLPKIFYKYQLPPARDEWIPLSTPSSAKAVTALEDYEIGWHQNFYTKNTPDWEALSPDIQTALQARFKNPSFFSSPPSTPLKGRISKEFPWSHVAAGVAIGALGIAAYYALSSSQDPLTISTALVPAGPLLDKSPVHIPLSFLRKPVEKILEPSTALIAAGPLLDHTVPRLNLSGIQIIDKFFQYAAPSVLPITQNTAIPELLSNLSAVQKTEDIADKTLSSIIPFSLSTWGAIAVATLAISSTAYALTRGRRKIDPVGFGPKDKPFVQPNNQPLNHLIDDALRAEQPDSHIASDVNPVRASEEREVVTIESEANQNTKEQQENRLVLFGPEDREAKLGKLKHSTVSDFNHHDKQRNPSSYSSLSNPEIRKPPTDVITIKQDEVPVLPRGRSQSSEHLEKVKPIQAVKKKDVEATKSTPPRTLTNQKFMDYCKKYHVQYDYKTAWYDAIEGVDLFQRIRDEEPVKSSEDNLRKICWGMMAHKIEQGKGFENGTITLIDPGYRLFNTFYSWKGTYGRASSHFIKRAIPVKTGLWKGYSHFGADIENLPPNMKTILTGMITSPTGQDTIYIKLEDWGADPRLVSLEKTKHFFFHTFGFLTSQYRRYMGTNQTDEDRKEHMNPKDEKSIKHFVELVKDLLEEKEPDLKEWGFIEAVPYLVKALGHPEIEKSTANAIRKYLGELDERFGEKLATQKGEEGQIDKSLIYDSPSDIRSAAQLLHSVESDEEGSSNPDEINLEGSWNFIDNPEE